MNHSSLFLLALLSALSLAGNANAQTPSTAPESPPQSAAPVAGAEAELVSQPAAVSPTPDSAVHLEQPAKQLHVSIAPYVWLTSFSGDIKVRNVEFDATASFVDILEKSDRLFGLMGAVDVNYDRLVFQFDALWTTAEISKAESFLRNGTASGKLDLNASWIEFFGGYRFLDRPIGKDPESKRRLTLDGFVGGRVTLVDVDATLRASTSVTLPNGEVLSRGATRELSTSEEWFEPFVGAQLGLDLTKNWALNLRGDVGGFGVLGSDFAWQTAALLGYRWQKDGWTLAMFGGYRAIGQDRSNGDLGWNLVTHGPLIGAQFSFAF